MARYRIKCWIPIDSEEDQLYQTLEEARRDLKHYCLLQPENIYKIVPSDDHVAKGADDREEFEGRIEGEEECTE